MKQHRVSDLIAQLTAIRDQHGDLPVYVYGADQRRDMRMSAECVSLVYGKPTFGQPETPALAVTISALLPAREGEVDA